MEKTKQLVMWLLIISAACIANPPRTARELTTLLQEAQYQERTAGNLDKAIELYGQVLTEAAQVERLAARAAFQLAVCYQKKGDTAKAAEYFRKVVTDFPSQKSLAEQAAQELEKIEPKQNDSVFEQMDYQVIRLISEQFGKTAYEANQKHLLVNSQIYHVSEDGFLYQGGMNGFYNWTGRTITEKVRFGGTSYPNQTLYGVDGRELKTEIVPDETRPNHWQIYWIPDEPLAPEEAMYYGWSMDEKRKLTQLPGDAYSLRMQNMFGQPVIETFFLVLPNNMKISQSSPPTGKEALLNFDVYWWTQQLGQNENHVETMTIIPLRDASPEEIASLVEKAVLTISTCHETDPRVRKSLDSLKGIQEEPVVAAVSAYLGEESPTVRRSAIYILWRGEFSDISAAEQGLLELCDHPENLTRGMAAIALGGNKVSDAYDAIARMTLHDEDAYARRCAAYALGLLDDPKALPVLEKALQDPEDPVKQNAQAAIAMLTKLETPENEMPKPDPNLTQEMHNDIQPDGSIKFRHPQRIVNTGTEPIIEKRFFSSDFVQLTAIKDEQGKPIDFTATHDSHSQMYRYQVIFDKPILPGESMVYISDGTISGLVNPMKNQEDTYRYFLTHSPATGKPTLRIEHYLLPHGAELLTTFPEDIQRGEKDGRIELRVEKVIPAGGSLTTSFTYKLAQ